ncbi:hypothetical protein [Streptomyces sp. ODS28]|uniref:hypothetical protein n=1 Tax=Streptomyces sp. ODS28 TaxID=3136688 RepID=UPI0031EE72E1
MRIRAVLAACLLAVTALVGIGSAAIASDPSSLPDSMDSLGDSVMSAMEHAVD